jgi:hypothetical protein
VAVASLVRRTLGLKNHRVVNVADDHGRVVVWLERICRRHLPCSLCGTSIRSSRGDVREVPTVIAYLGRSRRVGAR